MERVTTNTKITDSEAATAETASWIKKYYACWNKSNKIIDDENNILQKIYINEQCFTINNN